MKYEQFLDEAPIALIRFDMKTGEILLANQSAEQILRGSHNMSEITDYDELMSNLKDSSLENHDVRLNLPEKTVWVSARFKVNGPYVDGSLIDISQNIEVRERQLISLKEIGKKLDRKIASLQ